MLNLLKRFEHFIVLTLILMMMVPERDRTHPRLTRRTISKITTVNQTWKSYCPSCACGWGGAGSGASSTGDWGG
jgi:hypothetical protein